MNIVMVAARSFPIIKAGYAICQMLAEYEARDTITIHTRGGETGPDAFIHTSAEIMGFNTRRWPAEGGASNYIRDVEMVKDADIIYAFFDAEHIGEGGTQHVVDKGLDQHKRIHSYIWDGRGLELIGSADREGFPDRDEEPSWGVSQVTGEEASKRTSSSGTPAKGGPVFGAGRAARSRDARPYPQD